MDTARGEDLGRYFHTLINSQGDVHGQTQTASSSFAHCAPWNHPLDVHFAARSPLGWPKLEVQVHQLDEVRVSHGAN